MYSEGFIEEAISLVKEFLPEANWQMETDYAILFLKEKNKTICFITNVALHKIPVLKFRHYITEFHWNSNREASKSRLCSLMGVTKRIHARQCTLGRISRTEAKLFVDANHTMGYANSYFNYALFYKQDVVAMACFSKGRRMDRLPQNKKSFELIRFCNKNYFTVVGGLSKLIHYFEEEQKPGDMMTYVDMVWGEPDTYYALGFVLDQITPAITITIQSLGEMENEYTNKGNYKLIKNRV